MTANYITEYLPICKRFEGAVRSMYLDTRANVTVGVGFLIPNELSACGYPFYLPGAILEALPSDITLAFNKVKAMVPGQPALAYAYMGCLVLRDADIDHLLLATLQGIDDTLEKTYTNFLAWPDSAKMGIMDMAFNLGATELRSGYPRFNAAAQVANFGVMAAECNREGIQAPTKSWRGDLDFRRLQTRNGWTREQFVIAANSVGG